jgi:hypothetical protein
MELNEEEQKRHNHSNVRLHVFKTRTSGNYCLICKDWFMPLPHKPENMKLSDYSVLINALALKHPNAKVIFATNQAGDNYQPVLHEPLAGAYMVNNEDGDGDFLSGEHTNNINAVCVN